jgi:hypothetical protein
VTPLVPRPPSLPPGRPPSARLPPMSQNNALQPAAPNAAVPPRGPPPRGPSATPRAALVRPGAINFSHQPPPVRPPMPNQLSVSGGNNPPAIMAPPGNSSPNHFLNPDVHDLIVVYRMGSSFEICSARTRSPSPWKSAKTTRSNNFYQ